MDSSIRFQASSLTRSLLSFPGRRLPLHSRLLTSYGTPEGTSLSRQKDLKKLPVAPLDQTLSRFQKTIPQFLSQDEWQTSQKVVADFGRPGGIGERLQALLEAKAQTTNNWVNSIPFNKSRINVNRINWVYFLSWQIGG